MDFEMMPNLVYGFTSQASGSTATKPNEAYEVPLPIARNHTESYDYVNP